MPKRPRERTDEELIAEGEYLDSLTDDQIAEIWNKATPVDVRWVDKTGGKRAATQAQKTVKPRRAVAKTVKKPASTARSPRR